LDTKEKPTKTHEDDVNFMVDNPMLYMVLIPSLIAIVPPTLAVTVIWFHQYYIGV